MKRPVIILHEKLGYVAKDISSNVASQGKTIEECFETAKKITGQDYKTE